MAKIVTVPNPILRQKSHPITDNGEAKELVKKLEEAIGRKEGAVVGVGLAAIQIGIPKRVFIAYSKSSKKFLSFINPEIVWYSKRKNTGIPDSKNKFEGCLSVPGKWGLVSRPKKIKIIYQTPEGQKMTRSFSGQTATIIQHEYDHLDGILFIDRILEQRGKLFELVSDEEGKEFLEEIKC